jgi:hypothetical protein
MKTSKEADAYNVNIYIAGDLKAIEQSCREFCMRGLCVTVTPTNYIYKGGQESGAIVGLVNYPRFPATPISLWSQAEQLGRWILNSACQESFMLSDGVKTVWFTNRDQT